MHPNVQRFCGIASADARTIIGLMSGTSLDGLDIALCHFSGSGLQTNLELRAFRTVPFSDQFRSEVRAVFAKKTIDFEQLCLLNGWIARQHGSMILDTIAEWGMQASDIDLLASHGQTVYHAPLSLHHKRDFGNATLQIGDGDHLAMHTGIITVSDFRQKHIAAGGEGAPLAVYGDYLIFSKPGEDRIMLNIGGIANFTFLPADGDVTAVFSTDTGPGNTLMDAYMQKHLGQPFDKDAAVALSGQPDPQLLKALLEHPFFQEPFPKTTGPEMFHLPYLYAAQEKTGTGHLSHGDVMATLNQFSAVAIADAIKRSLQPGRAYTCYSSGGGMHNPLLMQTVASALPGMRFSTTDQLQVHPDAKEAVLFAVLANETVAGNGSLVGNPAAGIPAVTMGKISFPS